MSAGILLIDKPRGVSSAQVISQVKRKLKPRRIGHAGTLDPLATGLLVCLIDSATRLAQYAEGGTKVYSGVFRFGITTSTDDIEGAVLTEKPVQFSDAELLSAAKNFLGTISQIPPQVSAIKIDGVRAYEMARRNETVVFEPRSVRVDECALERINKNQARFKIRCSKGTYIRSIARDLGEALKCGGAVEKLRREYSAPFSVSDAVTVDAVSNDALLPWERMFPAAPRLALEDPQLLALAGGDQRCLASDSLTAAVKELTAKNSGAGVVLYGARNNAVSAGILSWNGADLRLGIHLS